MQDHHLSSYAAGLDTAGFTIIPDVFSIATVDAMLTTIAHIDHAGPNFRRTADLFAIRRFLQEVPAIAVQVFSPALQQIVQQLLGEDYFLVKSIYFDKPGASNWLVAWHQDLTISVAEKLPAPGYERWSVKQDQYAVQPPVDVLESNYTIRIHLDDTDEQNGALKVLPGTHRKGIYRADSIDFDATPEVCCAVKKGGVMIMRPLLMHASGRSSNGHNRRVIHLEFSNRTLAGGLQWAERPA